MNALNEKDKHIEELASLKEEGDTKRKTLEVRVGEAETRIRDLEDELTVEKQNSQTAELEQ